MVPEGANDMTTHTGSLPPPPPWVAAAPASSAKVARRSRFPRWAKITLPIVLSMLVAVVGAVLIFDATQANTILPGVRVEGTTVGGLSTDDATSVVQDLVSTAARQQVTLTGDDQVFPVSLADLKMTADVPATVERALDGEGGEGVWATVTGPFVRTYHRLTDTPLSVQVPVSYKVDDASVSALVQKVQAAVDRPMVDSNVDVSSGKLHITPSQIGRTVDVPAAVALVTQQADGWGHGQMPEGGKLALPVAMIQPEVTEANIGRILHVSKADKQVHVYEGATMVISYPVAIGTPDHPTPVGDFKIVNKRKNPTWVNPAPNGWGASMPKSIAPGPSNPLGTRAIDISASGIRFHGTNNRSSVGTAASHGCMRMLKEDVEALFERVSVGDRVIITP